jgi:drebrin-like protein
MSLQVNLSAPDIRQAYESVLNGSSDYLILTYEKGLSNDLRVQAKGSGDLDDVAEEFSDGRIQYAFVRVKDPNTQLPKFVIINWCGEGVPENRKGLFASHSGSVASYFKTYHVSIQARTEADVSPQLIMKKVTDSSGSKYSAGGAAANTAKAVPIAPVGSSYKPIGAPDIRGMQSSAGAGGAKKDVIQPVGSAYQPARNELQNIRASSNSASSGTVPPPSASKPASYGAGAGSGGGGAPAVRGPLASTPAPPSSSIKTAPDFGESDDFAAPAPRSSATPATQAPVSAPSFATPPASAPAAAPAPSASSSAGPAKPAAEDRIGPVGTAYQPVQLAKPGKLSANRFPFGGSSAQTDSTPAPAPRVPSAGGAPGKLTWSQRQEAAKKEREREEEEAQAKIGASKNAIGAAAGVGAGAGAAMGAAAAASSIPRAPAAPAAPAFNEPEEDAAPPPPPPPVSVRIQTS